MRKLLAAFAALAVALALFAPLGVRAQAQEETGILRVIHSAAGAPGIDVFVDGQRAVESQDYFSVSSNIRLQPGTREVRVNPSGAGSANPLIGKVVTVEPGEAYTLAVIKQGSGIQGLLLEDSTSSPEAGEAQVRIIHAAPGAGAVDVSVAGSQTPFLTNVGYGAATYVDVPPGSYSLDLSRADTGDSLLRTLQLQLLAGWTYTLVVTGDRPDDLWVQAIVDRVK